MRKKMYRIHTVYGIYHKASNADLLNYDIAAWFCDVSPKAIVKVEFIGLTDFLKKPIDKQHNLCYTIIKK